MSDIAGDGAGRDGGGVAPRRRWYPRTLRGWVLSILVVLGLGLLMLYVEARSKPAWYEPPNPAEAAVQDRSLEAQNQYVKFRNAAQRPSEEPFYFVLTQEQVNSYLAVEYSNGHPSPPENPSVGEMLAPPMVQFAEGRVTLAAKLAGVPGNGVVSVQMSVDPAEAADGEAAVEPMWQLYIRGLKLGNLPVPSGMAKKQLRPGTAMGDAIARAMSATNDKGVGVAVNKALAGEAFPMTFKVRNRKSTVKAVEVTEGQLKVTFNHVP